MFGSQLVKYAMSVPANLDVDAAQRLFFLKRVRDLIRLQGRNVVESATVDLAGPEPAAAPGSGTEDAPVRLRVSRLTLRVQVLRVGVASTAGRGCVQYESLHVDAEAQEPLADLFERVQTQVAAAVRADTPTEFAPPLEAASGVSVLAWLLKVPQPLMAILAPSSVEWAEVRRDREEVALQRADLEKRTRKVQQEEAVLAAAKQAFDEENAARPASKKRKNGVSVAASNAAKSAAGECAGGLLSPMRPLPRPARPPLQPRLPPAPHALPTVPTPSPPPSILRE